MNKELIRELVSKELGDGYEVTISYVTKNNGEVLTGLMAKSLSMNIAPTVYLESFNDEEDEKKIARKIAVAVKRGMPTHDVDMTFMNEWERVKDGICFRLINREKNTERLKDSVSMPFMDLTIEFFYHFEHVEIGTGSITIKKEYAERWGVTAKELYETALVNMPRLYPAEETSMWEILKEMVCNVLGGDAPEEALAFMGLGPRGGSMTVLSNAGKMYGAGTIIYPGLLGRMANKIGGSFFVIPSSIHECILLKDDGMRADNPLTDMIRELNPQLDPQDVLSDNAYYYDALDGTLSVVGREDLKPWNADASVVA